MDEITLTGAVQSNVKSAESNGLLDNTDDCGGRCDVKGL